MVRMSLALAVQMVGMGSLLCSATYRSMASSSSPTLVKLSRVKRLVVMSRKMTSPPKPDSFELDAGRFLAGGSPGLRAIEAVADRVIALKAHALS